MFLPCNPEITEFLTGVGGGADETLGVEELIGADGAAPATKSTVFPGGLGVIDPRVFLTGLIKVESTVVTKLLINPGLDIV